MKIFILKQEHLDLLKEAYVEWQDCETGAPCIDPKRPYGNSDVEGDIAEILGWEINPEYEELSNSQRKKANELHKGTGIALQIVLQNIGKEIRLGEYQTKTDYDNKWVFVK